MGVGALVRRAYTPNIIEPHVKGAARSAALAPDN